MGRPLPEGERRFAAQRGRDHALQHRAAEALSGGLGRGRGEHASFFPMEVNVSPTLMLLTHLPRHLDRTVRVAQGSMLGGIGRQLMERQSEVLGGFW